MALDAIGLHVDHLGGVPLLGASPPLLAGASHLPLAATLLLRDVCRSVALHIPVTSWAMPIAYLFGRPEVKSATLSSFSLPLSDCGGSRRALVRSQSGFTGCLVSLALRRSPVKTALLHLCLAHACNHRRLSQHTRLAWPAFRAVANQLAVHRSRVSCYFISFPAL